MSHALLPVALVHAAQQAVQALEVRGPFGLVLFGLHALALAAVWRRWPGAMAAVAALGVAQCARSFPATGNHLYLGVVVSALFALLPSGEEGERLHLERCLRALPAIALAWAGAQKLVHGYWFDGQALGWLVRLRSDVRLSVGPLLGAAEVARLSALPLTGVGAGPFALEPAGWKVASNLLWAGELALPALALWRRARAHFWAPGLLAVWAMQWVAHEWGFALVMSNLLWVWAPPRAASVGRWLVVAALVPLALEGVGWLQLPAALAPALVRGGAP